MSERAKMLLPPSERAMFRFNGSASTLASLIAQMLEQIPELHDYFADLEVLRADKESLIEQLRQTRESLAMNDMTSPAVQPLVDLVATLLDGDYPGWRKEGYDDPHLYEYERALFAAMRPRITPCPPPA